MQLRTGSIKPTFDTAVTTDEREYPNTIRVGDGGAPSSSFGVQPGMELVEADDRGDVAWWKGTDVFGRIAQMGQRVTSPVANGTAGRYFDRVETQLQDIDTEESSSGVKTSINSILSMSTQQITLTVNGTEHEPEVEPRQLLIHALRDDMGYTGPNVGCETSKCGACTIHMDGDAVKACTVLAVQADGAEITTIEGLSRDGDHPLQESFQEEHGLQCGYCTPGMIMTASDFLSGEQEPEREEIRKALKGNICRCTGYQNIVNAVESAAEQMQTAATDGGVAEEGGE